MNRILIERAEWIDGQVALADDRAAHIVGTLHAVPGQRVRMGILDGPCGWGRVEAVEGDRVRLACAFDEAPPPAPAVDLLLALPRPKVMRRLWAPLASMGVGRIVLTNAAKVERHYFDAHVLQPGVYRPLLIEGLQQSGDTAVPDVRVVRRLKPFVEDELDGLFPNSVRLVTDPAAAVRIREAVKSCEESDRGRSGWNPTLQVPNDGGIVSPMEGRLPACGHVAVSDAAHVARRPPTPSQLPHPGQRRILAAVGPEGGWTEFELALLDSRGFVRCGMGDRTLRSDIACIALLALISDALQVRESCPGPFSRPA